MISRSEGIQKGRKCARRQIASWYLLTIWKQSKHKGKKQFTFYKIPNKIAFFFLFIGLFIYYLWFYPPNCARNIVVCKSEIFSLRKFFETIKGIQKSVPFITDENLASCALTLMLCAFVRTSKRARERERERIKRNFGAKMSKQCWL